MARVRTEPADLHADLIGKALADGWSFEPVSLIYQPVGFGSYHWLAADAGGRRIFVTADDLAAKLCGSSDTSDDAFGRLRHAFEAALSLRRDAGLDFVVAPVPAAGGQVLARLTERYSLVVHPYLASAQARPDGQFESGADRFAVLKLLIALHAATAVPPRRDEFEIPQAAELRTAMGQTGVAWNAGPYATPARDLLARHAEEVTVLLAAYDDLTRRVAARPERMVITHGEPHAANVLKTPEGFVFVDWDTALLAPPERDLWALAESDASILPAYSAATGTDIDRDALTLYRLWYDLCEIAGYVHLFRYPHSDTADSAEAWRNLRHFLRPADRWPELLRARERSSAQAGQVLPP